MIDFLTLYSGIDIPFEPLKLQIHQPRIREIGLLGEGDFFNGAHYLCLNKETLPQNQNHELDNFSNFQILQNLLKVPNKQTGTNLKLSVINLLTLLIPTHKITMTPNGFLLYNPATKETCSIDESTFEDFRLLVKDVLCLSEILKEEEVSYNPQGRKAEEIANKLRERHEKLARMAAEQFKSKSVLARYVSVLSIGLQIPVSELLDYTLCQLFDSMKRFELKQVSDVDLQVRLTGTKPDKEVDNWMDDIHKNN